MVSASELLLTEVFNTLQLFVHFFSYLPLSSHIRVTHPPPLPSVSAPYALLLHKKKLSIVSMLSPPKALSLVSRK